jgi:predicted nucleic acid-binding protein
VSAPILVDTGPIVALLSQSDEQHGVCVEQLRNIRSPLLTCWPVITEAAWLLRAYPTAVAKLLASLSGGPYRLAQLAGDDVSEISAILTKYRDLRIQLADAALLHLANREGIETLFTLDRRDFGAMRLKRGKRLHLIP